MPKAEALAAAPARAEALAREAAEAAKTADEAKKAVATATREAASLTAALRKLEGLKKRADAELAAADKALAAAKTDEAKAKAEDHKQKAATKAADLRTKLDTAKADAKPKLDAAAAAKEAAKAAADEKADTAKAASEAKLALEPVSIFISRATQKLYVRRNTHKPAPDGGGSVFDSTIEVPVTDPQSRAGRSAPMCSPRWRARRGLRWTAVTIDGARDAKAALDRITIPQEVLDRIGPTALPRSSIVISDEPLQRRDQLSHRVRRGAEPSAARRLHHAQADAAAWQTQSGGDGFGSFSSAAGSRSQPPSGNPRRRGGQVYQQPVQPQPSWW